MAFHQVGLGRLGVAYMGESKVDARSSFLEYVAYSDDGRRREAREKITWFIDGTLHLEHAGKKYAQNGGWTCGQPKMT